MLGFYNAIVGNSNEKDDEDLSEHAVQQSEFELHIEMRKLQLRINKDDELIKDKYTIAKKYRDSDESRYRQIMSEVNVILSERDELSDKLSALKNDETTLQHRKISANVDRTSVVHKNTIVKSINKNYEGYLNNAKELNKSNNTFKQIKSITSSIDTSVTEKQKEPTDEQKALAADYEQIAEMDRMNSLFRRSDESLKTVPRLRQTEASQSAENRVKTTAKVPVTADNAPSVSKRSVTNYDVHDLFDDDEFSHLSEILTQQKQQ